MMCVEDTVLVGLTSQQALSLCGHVRKELQDVLTKGAFHRAAAELAPYTKNIDIMFDIKKLKWQ